MPSNIDSKLRAQGYNPDEIKESLNRYIGEGRAFSSPQEYAGAVQEKRKAGETLDDPKTAEAFQTIAPSYFGEERRSPAMQTEFDFAPAAEVPDMPGAPEGATDILNAVIQQQQASPMTLPVAPGTPTRWQLQDAEAERQFDEQQALQQEQLDWDRERWKREFEYQQEQDAIANQLARARATSGGTAGGTTGGTVGGLAGADPFGSPFHEGGTQGERQALAEGAYMDEVTLAIEEGTPFDEIMRNIEDLSPQMVRDGADPERIMKYAVDAFDHYYGEMDTAWHPTHDRAERRKYQDFLDQKEGVMERLDPPEEEEREPRPSEMYSQSEKLHMLSVIDEIDNMTRLEQMLDIDEQTVISMYRNALGV